MSRYEDAVNLFMDRLARDLEAGTVRPVEFYQAEYPQCALEIVDVYAAMTGTAVDAPSQRHIGDYLLLQQIGIGGTSIVYSALPADRDRLVALKVLTATFDEKRIKRFQREADIVERLDHDGIARVYEHGEHEGSHFLAMEWIDGKPLSDSIVRGAAPAANLAAMTTAAGARASIEHACRTVAAILRALAAAHGKGVVHRDLKPANVMIDSRDRVVLIDFGFAADNEDIDNSISLSGDVVGTPYYMAPEQLDRRTTQGSADVWAAGVVLYELLTGQRPFDGPSTLEIGKAIRSRDPVDVRRRNRSVGPELAACIDMALRKETAGRYVSAEQFADDLDRVVRGEPVLARRVGSVQRVARLAQRHPLAASIAAFIFGLLVVIAFLSDQSSRGWEARAATSNELADIARTLAHVLIDSARFDSQRREGQEKGLVVGYAKDEQLRNSLNGANAGLMKLADRYPNDERFVAADALVADALGLILFLLERYDEAQPLFARAIDRNRRLRELQPDVAVHQSDQIRAMLRSAMSRKEGQDLAASLTELELASTEATLAWQQLGIGWAKAQADVFNNIANLYMEHGKFDRAFEEFERLATLLPSLAVSDEEQTRDWVLLHYLASRCALAGSKPRDARAADHVSRCRRALAQWDAFRAGDPAKPEDASVEIVRASLE